MILEQFVEQDAAADGYSRAVLHTTKNGASLLAHLVNKYAPEPHEASLIEALKAALSPTSNQSPI